MPTPTYTPLANITLGSSASSVSFSSIPASFRDLVLVFSGTLSGNNGMNVRFNGDTGSNYSRVLILGDGSTTVGGSSNTADFMEGGTVVSTALLNIMEYSVTDKQKTVIGRNGPANNIVTVLTGRWANTAAINQIVISPVSQTISAGSTFALYAIAS